MIFLIIQDQFYTIQNHHRSPIPQTSIWPGSFFAVPYSKLALVRSYCSNIYAVGRSRRTLQGTRRRAHSFERIQKFPDFPIAHTSLSYGTMANYIICILFKLIGSFFSLQEMGLQCTFLQNHSLKINPSCCLML